MNHALRNARQWQRIALSLSLAGAMGIGCIGEVGTAPVPIGFSIEAEEDDRFAGTYNSGESVVRVNARSAGGEVSVVAHVDGHVMTLAFDVDRQNLVLDGGDIVLSDEQKRALGALSKAIEDHSSPETATNALAMAVQAAGYWGAAPTAFVHEARYVDARLYSVNDDGVQCVNGDIGETRNAYWTDSAGSWYARPRVGGCYDHSGDSRNDDCAGRCGAGCGKWWLLNGWSQDCLDHDMCGYFNDAGGGSDDPNCGDEYRDAADDWLGAGWTCGGSHNPLGC